MAQFVVRNIEREVKSRLKRRAARHGRSMEEEVREILRNAVNEQDAAVGGARDRNRIPVCGHGAQGRNPRAA
jgi:plasmid stability protein